MADVAQTILGIGILIGFWWGVFAVIRLFDPRPRAAPRPRPMGAAPLPTGGAIPRPIAVASSVRATHCCPDCTPGCQITGLAGGQAFGPGEGWWGQPFGDGGPNSEAMVFWGDSCCPDCSRCPVCQGI